MFRAREEGNLVIRGRPGAGKTTAALQIATSGAYQNVWYSSWDESLECVHQKAVAVGSPSAVGRLKLFLADLAWLESVVDADADLVVLDGYPREVLISVRWQRCKFQTIIAYSPRKDGEPISILEQFADKVIRIDAKQGYPTLRVISTEKDRNGPSGQQLARIARSGFSRICPYSDDDRGWYDDVSDSEPLL